MVVADKKGSNAVALVNVRDYPKDKYSAHWMIWLDEDPTDGFEWRVTVDSYEPIGYQWGEEVHDTWPDGAPRPIYPADIPVRQDEFMRMPKAQQKEIIALQEARRAECSRIFEASPRAIHFLEEVKGVAPTLEEARAQSQKAVIEVMKKYKRPDPPKNAEAGNAIPMGPAGMIGEVLWEFLRWVSRPLLALAFSTTIRNERAQRIQVNIDLGAGAGLWRIYNGTRPASGGTATTLLATLTFSDPCAPSASGGVLTFSSVTADSSADATSTATWFRMVDSTGTFCVDGDVGTSGSDLNLNSTSINTGVNVAISSAALTEGNA